MFVFVCDFTFAIIAAKTMVVFRQFSRRPVQRVVAMGAFSVVVRFFGRWLERVFVIHWAAPSSTVGLLDALVASHGTVGSSLLCHYKWHRFYLLE